MNVGAHIGHIIQQRIADPLVSTTPNIDVLVPLPILKQLVRFDRGLRDCELHIQSLTQRSLR